MKHLYLLLLLNLTASVFSLETALPKPADDFLYTEYEARQSSPLLKKPLISTGYLAMSGKDRFVFKQLTPALLTIKVINRIIYLTIKDQKPVRLPESDEANPLFTLFDSNTAITGKYRITRTQSGGQDLYEIVPVQKKTFKKITARGTGDKITQVLIELQNNSVIEYRFTNTVTGIKPDEKLFN